MTIIHAHPLKNFGVSGPASAVNNEAVVFDGTTGKKIKASGVSIASGSIFKNADTSTKFFIGSNSLDLRVGGESKIHCTPSQVAVNVNEDAVNFKVSGQDLSALFYTDGTNHRVGINQEVPVCRLHITDGAILAEGTTGATPVSGAGTRMMWIPAKSAFRAGAVTSDQWDDANIGEGSVVFGYNGKAGHYGTTFGSRGDTSVGEVGTHFGQEGITSGDYATHFGFCGHAGGLCSTHFGYIGTADGAYATHFGDHGKADGDYSWVGGRKMQLSAAADNSFAFGHSPVFSIALTQPNTFYIFPSGTAGKVAIGVTVPTAMVDIGSDIIRLRNSKTPATAGAAGSQGDICFDSDFGYRCVATNTWKRWAIATW